MGNFYPAANSLFRLMEVLTQSNSLVSPILYSYRDRRIRKAVLELLGMRKPHASQPEAFAPRSLKANESCGSVRQTNKFLAHKSSMELGARPSSNKYGSRQLYKQPRLTRSASCDAATSVEFFHSLTKPYEIFLKRKVSA